MRRLQSGYPPCQLARFVLVALESEETGGKGGFGLVMIGIRATSVWPLAHGRCG